MQAALESKIDAFIGEIELGIRCFKSAGKKLVDILDADPKAMDDILRYSDAPAWLTRDVLETFEAIGRNTLAVEAMFLPKHVLERVIDLPVGVQSDIATQPVRHLNGGLAGKKFEAKKARDLTFREAAVAIGPNGVRSDRQQIRVASSWTKVKFETVDVLVIERTKDGFYSATKVGTATANAQDIRFDDGKATVILRRKVSR